MEAKETQNHIVIRKNIHDGRQKLPVNLLLSLAAGAITGSGFIFVVLWGIELLLGH